MIAKKFTVNSYNLLEVTVGTNCPKGGDSGHGGLTYFKLEDMGGTDLRLKINGRFVEVQCVEVLLGGDSESTTFAEALYLAGREIKKQNHVNLGMEKGYNLNIGEEVMLENSVFNC